MKTRFFLVVVISAAISFGWDLACMAIFEKYSWKLEEPFLVATWTGGFFDRMLMGCIALPIIEEILFRLPLSLVYRRSVGIRCVSLLLTSLLFGYLHGGPFQAAHKIPHSIVLGLCFLYVARLSQSPTRALIASILAHSAGNWMISKYLGLI